MSLVVKIKKLRPDAKLPTYAHPGDAGMDLFSVETVVIKSGERAKISTGIAMEIPDGYVGLVWDKSGLASNYMLKNLGGVMDAGYRGEYIITLVNLGKEDYVLEKNHKIAQLLIQKIERPVVIEEAELSESARGDAGFGSTGK